MCYTLYRILLINSINAGCNALPALLNIKHVMQQRQVTGIWNGKDELPVSFLDVCKLLSIFSCQQNAVLNRFRLRSI